MPNNKKQKRLKKEKIESRYDRCFKEYAEQIKIYCNEEISKSKSDYITKCGEPDDFTCRIIEYVFYLNLLRKYSLTEVIVAQRIKTKNFDDFGDMDFFKILYGYKTLKNYQTQFGASGITPAVFMKEMVNYFARINKIG